MKLRQYYSGFGISCVGQIFMKRRLNVSLENAFGRNFIATRMAVRKYFRLLILFHVNQYNDDNDALSFKYVTVPTALTKAIIA